MFFSKDCLWAENSDKKIGGKPMKTLLLCILSITLKIIKWGPRQLSGNVNHNSKPWNFSICQPELNFFDLIDNPLQRAYLGTIVMEVVKGQFDL